MVVNSLNDIEVSGVSYNSIIAALAASGPEAQELENLMLIYEAELLQQAALGEQAKNQEWMAQLTKDEQEIQALELRLSEIKNRIQQTKQ